MSSLSVIVGINEGGQIVTNEEFKVGDLKTLLFSLNFHDSMVHQSIYILICFS